jgi:sugar phosphate isomerase/epimerase
VKLSISNIAWDVAEDDIVGDLLRRNAFDAIDVAPGKYFPDPQSATDEDVRAVRRRWADRGIGIIGMQSLLFGTHGLNLFGPAASREAMLRHLAAICRIGGGLGATRLVFGSPRNRDRGSLDDAGAWRIAIPFFRALGDIASDSGVVVCLEPNPSRYGANFMTTAAETAAVVAEVAHPAIRMQFDTGAITLSSEDPASFLAGSAGLVAHVHASEPDLVPLGDGACDHRTLGRLLACWLPSVVVAIEMVATSDEPHVGAIARAIGVANDAYRSKNGASS